MRTLVLNAGYEPLAVVSFKRALVLVMNQKATIIAADAEHPVWASGGAWERPSVIILRKPATTAPAPIASAAELNAATRVTLVGFGNDDIQSTKGFGVKRIVEVDMVSIRRASTDNLDADEQKFGYESDLEFVAGGNGFDTCNGDSGGPVYISVGGVTKVAGLT